MDNGLLVCRPGRRKGNSTDNSCVRDSVKRMKLSSSFVSTISLFFIVLRTESITSPKNNAREPLTDGCTWNDIHPMSTHAFHLQNNLRAPPLKRPPFFGQLAHQ